MKNKALFLLIAFGAWMNNQLIYSQNQSDALRYFLQSSDLHHAAISFEMKDLSSGKVVSAYNENMSLIPASVNKIITTATALEILGADYKYKTDLYYDGFIRDSVLTGNLFIEGGGDPTLGSEFIEQDKHLFLNNWLNDIRKKGIRRINGDIYVLDQLFGYKGIPGKWLWEDMGNYYAPGIYGISIFDNMYRIYLRSSIPGKATEILYTKPQMNDLLFNNEILSGSSNADKSDVSGIPFGTERTLSGTIPPNRTEFPVRGDIPDPGMYLGTYFKSYLQENGISVSGKVTTSRLNHVNREGAILLSEVLSPDLSSIIRVINVRSNNHYAEHLYKLLTIKENVDIPAFWKGKGLDSLALFLCDGSGVSPQNAVSAAFVNSVLEYMYKKEGTTGAYYQSLPLVGKEGTVVSFLKGSALEGKARVKSGSITNVCSYAGYIDYQGKMYVFTLIINNFNGTRVQVRNEITKLLVGLL